MNDKIHKSALELVNHIVDKYNINSYDGFACDKFKQLAMDLEIFSNVDPITII